VLVIGVHRIYNYRNTVFQERDMSWDINHVVLVGRLTKDPELTYTQSGAAVCRFSIAVNRSSGQSTEGDGSANFFNIVAWNKTAEICNQYLAKGRQVAIDGRLQQRRWEGSDGVKRNTVEIVANNVQFFGPARGTSGQYGSPGQRDGQVEPFEDRGTGGSPYGNGGRKESSKPLSVNEGGEESNPFLSELDDDEIPF
jgi:single-strand DNA-binding protein